MTLLELFLREHALGHTRSVAPSEFNIDYLLDGLTDTHFRMTPHGMNSLAWIFWHTARVEDAYVSLVVAGSPQLFDDTWKRQLRISVTGVSTSKDSVEELSRQIDLAALLEYRNSVGRRTRTMVQELWPDQWAAPIESTDVRNAVSAGIAAPELEDFLKGRSRESSLFWWGLNHTLMHIGQANMLHGIVTRT